MRRLALTLAIVLAACTTPLAAPVVPSAAAETASPVPPGLPPSASASLDPSAAPAGTYVIDSRHANVIWRVRHRGLSIYTGRFDGCLSAQGATCATPGITATITFNPQQLEQSSVTATIQVAALSTGLVGPQGQRDFDHEIGNVLSGNGANPQISFVSTSATRTGPTTGLLAGNLTLHGQTHPATMEVTFQGGKQAGGKYVIAFTGRMVIQRTQWGAGNLILNQFVSDDTEIVINGEFAQQ